MITYDELTDFRADVEPMSEQAYQDGLNRLHAEIAPRRNRRWWYAGIAVAAAAACLVTGVVATSGHQPSTSAAAEILQDAAAQAKLKPSVHPKPGQWVYLRSESFDGGVHDVFEEWMPESVQSGGALVFGTSQPRYQMPPYGGQYASLYYAPYGMLQALPTTPKAMFAAISRDACGQARPTETKQLAIWNCARTIIDAAPPAQQAALFGAIARLSSVYVAGTVTTFDHRTGTALAVQDPVLGLVEMVFDNSTHEYLGQRVVPPGRATVDFNAGPVVNPVVVDHAGDRP